MHLLVKLQEKTVITHTPSKDAKRINVNDWLAEARELFGDNVDDWKFVCPMCGNIQSVADFRKLHDEGHKTNPEDAYFNCIGRYIGGRSAFLEDKKEGPPCDYTLGGLFCMAKTFVNKDGKDHPVFEFYREDA